MADISRQSSPHINPSSASPSRPSPLSRPHWPYSTYTHRSSSSVASGNSTGQSWDPRTSSSPSLSSSTPIRRQSSLINSAPLVVQQDENMRHWSFTAFEWIVKDVQKLSQFVENDAASAEDNNEDLEGNPTAADFEILKESPVLGDGKFKLEIAKSPIPDASGSTTPLIRTQPPTLTLFVTSVMLEYAHTDYEIYTSMFAGIKCQDDRVGERGARPDWAWEFWQSDWIFREDSEVWECPLPALSTLLENPRIRETDSFVICVQIHSPVGPFFPQQPSVSYVPRDLLDGLEASLDNANTGDVQFICLERKDASEILDEYPQTPNAETNQNRRSSSSSGTLQPQSIARKRVIYAHSDILKRRSEYFTTMLNSSFAENLSDARIGGDRRIYSIVVEEADFVTIYWLLKWVYANWLLFKEHDDPKAAVDGVGAGWSAKSISNSVDEWGWKTFSKSGFSDLLQDSSLTSDARSATSGESVSVHRGPRSKGKLSAGPSQDNLKSIGANRVKSSTSTSTTKASTSSRPPPSPTRRSSSTMSASSNPGNSSTLAIPVTSPTSPSTSRSSVKPVPVPISTSHSTSYPSTPAHYPVSPRQQRQRSRTTPTAATDPHPHPTPAPSPASALSMYQLAHRYEMPGLAALALEHIMSTITPQTSFALLLASSTWDELQSLVEDYVVEKWDEVSVSTEFEQCCEEVAAGEWGHEGGRTLMALFRRLRSPHSVAYTRG